MGRFPFAKEALKSLFKPPVTANYPKVPVTTPEKYRGKIKFHPETCLGCGMCVRVCAPGAIVKTMKPIEGGQEITLTFDLGSCTFCAMCADFCAKKSIEFTQEFSMVTSNKEDLIISGSFIKKLPPKPPVPPKAPVGANAAAGKPAAPVANAAANAPAKAAAPASEAPKAAPVAKEVPTAKEAVPPVKPAEPVVEDAKPVEPAKEIEVKAPETVAAEK